MNQISQRKMKHEKINIMCLIYLITWSFMPVFAYYTSGMIFRLLYAVIVIVWFFTGLENITMKTFYPVMAMGMFLLVMFIYYISGYGNIELLDFINYILLLDIGINSTLYIKKISIRRKQKLKKYVLGCISITLCTTISALYKNPVAARLLTSSSTESQIADALKKSNVGAFDFIYGLVIVLPVLVYVATQKKEKIKKIMYIILIVLSLICIFKSNFTIAYILFVVDIILYLFFQSNSIWGKIISETLLLIFLLFGKKIIEIYIEFLIGNTTSIWSKIKLESIMNILNGEGSLSETTSRISLLLRDINSFFSSPILGKGAFYGVGSSDFIGQHSQFLDELARYGLLGGILLFYFIYICIKRIWKSIEDKVLKNKYLITTIVFIMLGFLNPIFNGGILFFYFIVIPILIEERTTMDR